MVDVVDKATRSRMMSGIRSQNTSPEIRLRKALHRLGWRFRLHASKLPGSPDIVLPSRKIAIFVHGCFWHRHANCHWCTTPSSNAGFWAAKFAANLERDHRNQLALAEAKWRVAIAWECGLRPIFFDDTVAEIAEWAANESGRYESRLVRPKQI